MLMLSLEEFSSRRRKAQADIETALRPIVRRALDTQTDTSGWTELLDEVAAQWRTVYADESGKTGPGMSATFRHELRDTLQKTDRAGATEATEDRITVWLATALLSHATMMASDDDPDELFMEWVTMEDDAVREAHREAHGQQRPIGDKFTVGGHKMRFPGDPRVPMELWMNDRCTLRPVLASEVIAAQTKALSSFRDVSTEERKKDADAGRALEDGSFPIDNCSDLRNAIQAIGRAKDPAKAKAHIKKRKSALGCPEVTLPEGWATDTITANTEETVMSEIEATPTEGMEPLPPEPVRVPWHGVIAPEGKWSGDKRKFAEGSLRTRPLPLPLTWQKQSAGGHDGNITVATIDRLTRKDGEVRGSGYMLSTAEADEVIGLLTDFGRFGVSVDADDTSFEMNDEEEGVIFTDSRAASACIVPIPAFAEAWVGLGEPDDEFHGDDLAVAGPNDQRDALVASITAADVAPGRTEDGPGWLTHPVDTDRLRDYWVRGPGAAKIGWGTPGDFNRCRINVAEYVKPQHINGYCANRHFDALGFWPGPKSHAGDSLEFTETSEALNLVASGGYCAPSEWFEDPKFEKVTPMTITEDGEVFGHVADWTSCHTQWADTCVTAPRSQADYAYFRLGAVLTDKGEVPVGPLTIGGGHAGPGLSMRAAIEHYDDASTVFADVACGEDAYGIWVHGWVRPGTSEEMIHAARASKLSGDWRYCAATGGLEMIGAHCVNSPGFAIPRIAASVQGGRQMSLVAAGVVIDEEQVEIPEGDVHALAVAVAREIEAMRLRKERIAALQARFDDTALKALGLTVNAGGE